MSQILPILCYHVLIFLVGKSVKKEVQPQKTPDKAAAKPVRKWGPQDDAARKIQARVRGFLARRLLQRKKKEKLDYEDLMEKLEKEVCV